MQFIRATHSGKDKALAIWDFAGYSDPHLSPAWGVITKARQAVEGYWSMSSTIESNERLNDAAKRDDKRAQAIMRASQIGEAKRQLNGLQRSFEQKKAQLLPVQKYDPADAATVAIDMEIARRFAQLEPTKQTAFLAFGEDQRVVDALLRLPTFVTGLSGEQYSKLVELSVARKYPEQAKQLAEEALALERAQESLTIAFEQLTGDMSLDEKVAAAGGDSGLIRRVPGEVVDSISERLQNEAQADDDAA